MNYNAKYVVRLTEQDREALRGIVGRGKVAIAKRLRAQVLLHADAGPDDSGPTDKHVAEAVGVSVTTVHSARQTYVEQGLSAAIERKPRTTHAPRKLDGVKEAVLVATVCSPAPTGQARWTLQLLSDRLVELNIVESISRECVRQTLKKTNSNRG